MDSEHYQITNSATFSLADLIALILDNRKLFFVTFLLLFGLIVSVILLEAPGQKVIATISVAESPTINPKAVLSRLDSSYLYQVANRDKKVRIPLIGAIKTRLQEGGSTIIISAKSSLDNRDALLAFFADITEVTLGTIWTQENIGKAKLIAEKGKLLADIEAARIQVSSATRNLERLDKVVVGYQEQIHLLRTILARSGIDKTSRLIAELKLTEYQSLLSNGGDQLKFEVPVRKATYQSILQKSIANLKEVEYQLSLYPLSRVLYGPVVVRELGPSRMIKLLLALLFSGFFSFFVVLVTVSVRRYKPQGSPT